MEMLMPNAQLKPTPARATLGAVFLAAMTAGTGYFYSFNVELSGLARLFAQGPYERRDRLDGIHFIALIRPTRLQ